MASFIFMRCFDDFFQANSNEETDSSDEESDNLDWLPDPDKIYGKDETTTENEEHKAEP